ncbi:hypothetical protein [Neisseria sicca]|nr:hypothetical protein [Neisseria sicca]
MRRIVLGKDSISGFRRPHIPKRHAHSGKMPTNVKRSSEKIAGIIVD